MKADTAFNKVTSHIISLLEDDIIPWRKPFNVSTSPINGASKHEYSGGNAWLLRLLNFDEPFFFGFKQINDEMDGLIKRGETGIPIIFLRLYYRDQKTVKNISSSKGKKRQTKKRA